MALKWAQLACCPSSFINYNPGMGTSLVAIFCGAGFGALLRAGFNVVGAGMVSGFPMGTLLANLFGGYLVGIAVAFFGNNAAIGP
jgi:CrcB protein